MKNFSTFTSALQVGSVDLCQPELLFFLCVWGSPAWPSAGLPHVFRFRRP